MNLNLFLSRYSRRSEMNFLPQGFRKLSY